MKEPEYTEGPKAAENFEEAMKTIFKAPKPVKKGKKKDTRSTSLRKQKRECVEFVASEKATHIVLRRQGHTDA